MAEEHLMQVLSFFVFVVMVVCFILAVGYGLRLLEGRDQRGRSPDLSRDVLREEDPKAEGEMKPSTARLNSVGFSRVSQWPHRGRTDNSESSITTCVPFVPTRRAHTYLPHHGGSTLAPQGYEARQRSWCDSHLIRSRSSAKTSMPAPLLVSSPLGRHRLRRCCLRPGGREGPF